MSISTVLCLLPMLLLSGGCATVPERELSQARPPYTVLPNGRDPLNPERMIEPGTAVQAAYIAEGMFPYFERVHGRPLNVLELSGGGQNGAFGAGFLKGWRETGQRPLFDLVTGVSTGALLATHAFLGTAEDDAVLEALFTTVTQKDIYRRSPLWRVLAGANSLYDTRPLKALLDKYITAEVLERVAEAHDNNRRLWVGTTNLDFGQTWGWNLTMIAKLKRPDALETYRKALLASASFPIAFPPVEIHGHLFADGAIRANVLVAGLVGDEAPRAPLYGPGNVYVIYNGKVREATSAVRNNLTGVAAASFGAIMNSSMESVLLRSYYAAAMHGYGFRMVATPTDVDIGNNPLAFDPRQMRAGFDAGYALAKQKDPWLPKPPNLGSIPAWALDTIIEGR